MDALRQGVKDIYIANQNVHRAHFVPEASLIELFSESAIKQALTTLEFAVHEIGALTQDILQGARKCFAILIWIDHAKSIASFFRSDSLQQSCPDDRLPFTLEALQQVFEMEASSPTITRFLQTQHNFAIPVLHQHAIFRKLDKKVILPILSEKFIGQGSMGRVWKMELHPKCHRLPLEKHKVIRKEIAYREGEDMAAFQKELKNLSLLAHVRHPNIVQLYCSYIYREGCNLIFALADGGSLSELLDGKSGVKGPEGSQLLLALTGLASAIDALHNFTSEVLDLSLSGCHHDLAPRNILIHGETFLLADFGLSTFRSTEEDSLTTFKEVRGSYVAPECQIFQQSKVKSQQISRASDIWSFGCILLEVLTHMTMGPDGVAQFRDERKIQVVDGIEWYRFHQGPGIPHPKVDDWLKKLQGGGEPAHSRMVDLIREMLSMDPHQRPRSARVLAVLRGISTLSLATSVSQSLESPCMIRSGIDYDLDSFRFQSWLFALNQLLDDTCPNQRGDPDFDFAEIIQALKEMKHTLGDRSIGTTGAKHSLLRYQQLRLVRALPSHYRSLAKENLVDQLLKSDNAKVLGGLSSAIAEAGNEDIGVLIAFRHLTILADQGDLAERDDLVLDHKSLTWMEDIDIHSLASLETNPEPVLVEWLKYGEAWAKEEIRRELLRRLASVVGLLHAESSSQIHGSLPCHGLFHDPTQRAFGIVYRPPVTNTKPVTLHSLLSPDRFLDQPLLELRFRLAFKICQCIYTFHKVGWLHRNLHSMNMLFFPPNEAPKAERAMEPWILGFAGSRENLLNCFSHGPNDDIELRRYQHPEYLTGKVRYKEEFDYYSVGVLLLEIGLWCPLSKITSALPNPASDEGIRAQIIARRVPSLAITMGTRYMKATRKCLDGSLAGGQEDSGSGVDANFKSQVLDQIPKIE